MVRAVAKGYRPVDRGQAFLLPPSMLDWLGEDHLVWFVIEAVNRLDTTAFHSRARLGGVGRRGYDPDMLLTLFVYAMAHGESSSRQIERLCHTDVAFRIVCAQDVPDYTVLARFRKDHADALADLLTESLVLAAELGLVSLGVVAFDGTKIAGNASRDANRGEVHLRRLAEEYLDNLATTDEAEDALFGEDDRGDGLPPQVRDRSGRAHRIDQALAQVKARRDEATATRQAREDKTRAYEQAARSGQARWGRPPRGVDQVAVAKARWQRERARAQARYDKMMARRAGRATAGARPVHPDEHGQVRTARAAYEAARTEAARTGAARTGAGSDAAAADSTGGPTKTDSTGKRLVANMTDPESRLLKTRNGWVQGYNCQTATSDDGFFVAARATQDSNDVEQFIPTMDDVTATADMLASRTGRDDLTVGTMVGDAGYDSTANLAADGPDRLIADSKRRTIDRRAAADPATADLAHNASAREKMTHRLRTPDGHALYKRRAPLIEAPNAWLKDGRGLRRFNRRGLAAANAELAFAAAVTNLLKIHTKGITTAQLQTP